MDAHHHWAMNCQQVCCSVYIILQIKPKLKFKPLMIIWRSLVWIQRNGLYNSSGLTRVLTIDIAYEGADFVIIVAKFWSTQFWDLAYPDQIPYSQLIFLPLAKTGRKKIIISTLLRKLWLKIKRSIDYTWALTFDLGQVKLQSIFLIQYECPFFENPTKKIFMMCAATSRSPAYIII